MSIKARKKRVLIFFAGISVLVITILAVLLGVSGIFLSREYLEPWKKNYSHQFDDPRIQLVSHGILAANGHNMQPWKVRLDPSNPMVFYLYTDGGRLTPEVDPFARQTLITEGTFLEYVKIAGMKLGYETAIALFPDGEYDEQHLKESMQSKPVAKIALKKVEPKDSPLYDFMFLPDTNREPYLESPLSVEQINVLQSIQNDTDISLKIFQDKKNLERLGKFAINGAIIEAGVNRISQESAKIFRANEYQKNKHRYGYSLEGQGFSGIMKHMMQGLITIIPSLSDEKAAADLFIKSTRTAVDHTPAYAMIITKDNTRIRQVKAGMLYSRFILTAHSLGYVMQPPSQVLEEYAEMKEQYDNIHKEYASDLGTIQMFIRLGKPTREALQTMRRDVMDIIETEPK